MKSFAILLTLILTQNVCYSQSLESSRRQIDDLRACDRNAMDLGDTKNCQTDKCRYEKHKQTAELACSKAFKEIFNHAAYFDSERAKTPKSSPRYKELQENQEKIFQTDLDRYIGAISDIEASYAEAARSKRRMDAADADLRTAQRDEIQQRRLQAGASEVINGLNMMQRSSPQNHQYQINGRLITCSTLNNLTTCN